ncbi:MAG: fibronectin-binding autotransporter adhesin, partial [Humisphaera sp.]|nr:fibronectin-binding autotransporter adhesin [Humisphaera sp.]
NGGATGANTDTATFATNPAPIAPDTWALVGVDANRNIRSLDFASSTLSFRIGTNTVNAGNTLYLSNGGVAQNSANAAGINGDVYAPIQFTGATYTFLNNNSNAASLRFQGDIIARPTGTTVLTLDGSHGSSSSSQAEINGALIDSPTGGILSIVKNGIGTWELNTPGARPSTYSGDTIINGGTLRSSTTSNTNGVGGFSPNSHYIVNDGAALRNSVAGNSVRRVTLNFGGQLLASATTGSTINMTSNAGPSLLMNFAAPTNQTLVRVRIPINLTGPVADEGGITLLSSTGVSGTPIVEIGDTGSAFSLGAARRPFDIGKGADANVDYDLRVRGPIAGSGGIVKKGAGTLRFDNLNNPFTGEVEIQQGTFILNENNSLTGLPTLMVNGGTLRLKSNQVQTFGAATIKKGSITGGNNLTVVHAPSYTFDVAAGDTASVDVAIADAGGASPVVKNGAGVANITLAPSYTGSTTVSAGTLGFAASLTSSPSITVTDGTLELRASQTDINRVINTGPVSITGSGRIDITRHKLITTTSAGNADINGVYSGIQGEVQRASNGGAWDSPGLTTSQGDAATGLTTIGVATGEQIRGLGPTDTDLFAGQTINGASTIAMYTYAGDANLDGFISGDDYSTIDFNVGTSADGYSNGDFNYDGIVSGDDYSTIDFNYAAQGAPFPTSGSAGVSGVTAVPEPAACGLAALAAAVLAPRRRRRIG